MNKQVKQVLIYRKDLKSRKGKIASQCAHASMKVILDMMSKESTVNFTTRELLLPTDSPTEIWLSGIFTKIVASVDSEKELLELYSTALEMDIPTALITDIGKTEFKGVPTNTCIAIGPWWSDELFKITGHLKLL